MLLMACLGLWIAPEPEVFIEVPFDCSAHTRHRRLDGTQRASRRLRAAHGRGCCASISAPARARTRDTGRLCSDRRAQYYGLAGKYLVQSFVCHPLGVSGSEIADNGDGGVEQVVRLLHG